MKPVAPCGTRAAYTRHKRAGEDPCEACTRAQSDYIKWYRASQPKKVFYPKDGEVPNAYEVRMAAALEKDPVVIGWRKNNHGVWVHTFIHDPHEDTGHNATKTAVARSRSLADAKHSEFPIDCENDQLKLLKGDAA